MPLLGRVCHRNNGRIAKDFDAPQGGFSRCGGSGQRALLPVIARSAERATRQSLPNTKRAFVYRDCHVGRLSCPPRNRLVAKYNADAMRVFSCVKRAKILLVALLQTAIFTRITRKNPSPIISRLNFATSLMTTRVYEQCGLYTPHDRGKMPRAARRNSLFVETFIPKQVIKVLTFRKSHDIL
jgi:hypothetical protein